TAVTLACVQGLAGLYLAFLVDAPPGPTVATLGAVLYALAALVGRGGRARAGNARTASRTSRPPGGRRSPESGHDGH
ncbi:MAG TPA: hypothetical protein VGR10_04245, partial [Thermoleophilaceae bacterium]|nr:hypothetical protein [Thermoleophilaceae bacterium]